MLWATDPPERAPHANRPLACRRPAARSSRPRPAGPREPFARWWIGRTCGHFTGAQSSTPPASEGPTPEKLGSGPASLRGPAPILSGFASRTRPCADPRSALLIRQSGRQGRSRPRRTSSVNPATGVSAQCRPRQSPPCESLAALSQPTVSLSTNPSPQHSVSASIAESSRATRPGRRTIPVTSPCRAFSSPRSGRPKWAAG
jgi:hypothetical protein